MKKPLRYRTFPSATAGLTPAVLDAVQWVPVPGATTFAELMDSDRDTARVFHRFRRPIHPLDIPLGVDPPGAVEVLVTTLAPGVRVRMFLTATGGPRPAA